MKILTKVFYGFAFTGFGLCIGSFLHLIYKYFMSFVVNYEIALEIMPFWVWIIIVLSLLSGISFMGLLFGGFIKSLLRKPTLRTPSAYGVLNEQRRRNKNRFVKEHFKQK